MNTYLEESRVTPYLTLQSIAEAIEEGCFCNDRLSANGLGKIRVQAELRPGLAALDSYAVVTRHVTVQKVVERVLVEGENETCVELVLGGPVGGPEDDEDSWVVALALAAGDAQARLGRYQRPLIRRRDRHRAVGARLSWIDQDDRAMGHVLLAAGTAAIAPPFIAARVALFFAATVASSVAVQACQRPREAELRRLFLDGLELAEGLSTEDMHAGLRAFDRIWLHRTTGLR